MRYIGVTGHGLTVASMHLRSLERFPFDSVLLPYNPRQMQHEHYAPEFEKLAAACAERGVAMQTIKSIALAPWDGRAKTAGTWYEPLTDPDDIEVAVHWVLGGRRSSSTPSATSSSCRTCSAAAERFDGRRPTDADVEALVERRALRPLFV